MFCHASSGAAVGCNLAVPAVLLSAVQSLPSQLSMACAVAEMGAPEGVAQGATLGEGEAQTGDDLPF